MTYKGKKIFLLVFVSMQWEWGSKKTQNLSNFKTLAMQEWKSQYSRNPKLKKKRKESKRRQI